MLQQAGVEPDAITVLIPAGSRDEATPTAPEGTHLVVHDPDDKTQLAYLANTERERRIYLNRLLTDADLVVPVGRIGPDPALGYRGPWSVIFPGMSNRETLGAFRAQASDEPPNPREPRASLVESSEVSWLLGCQFHVGIVAGTKGLVEVVAGIDSAVREQGTAKADQVWTFRPASRAELVIVGIGGPGVPTGLDDLAAGLTTATRLVRHGGKIVALSRAKGAVGPALGRLIEEADSRTGAAALRGHEHDPDYNAARQLARALNWADVYLLSDLDPQVVDDLSIIALGRPEEARRLATACHSCLVLSHAEQTLASVADEAE
jgi:nickel-dependent lactate racemase